MSRKDYIAAAAEFLRTKPARLDLKAQWTLDVYAMADVFQRDNFLFNRLRFLSACGMED